MSNTTAANPASIRIATLLDAGSFVEIGGAVTARATDFGMQEKETPADGVITGTESLTVTLYTCTVRTHPFWAERLARCMQKKSPLFTTWQ